MNSTTTAINVSFSYDHPGLHADENEHTPSFMEKLATVNRIIDNRIHMAVNNYLASIVDPDKVDVQKVADDVVRVAENVWPDPDITIDVKIDEVTIESVE